MKYIKKFFENYKEGDYVKTIYGIGYADNKIFKIIKKIEITDRVSQFKVINSKGNIQHLTRNDFKRKLTKKEIEKFDIELDTNRYNV